MLDYLPDEVLQEILQRLSVKSLIQLRCVSKSWNSLITGSAFINSHLSRSLSLPSNSNYFIARYYNNRFYVEHYKLIHVDNVSLDQIQQLEIPVKSHCIDHSILIGFANGLLSLYSLDLFILWNPSIRKFITLPKPSIKTHRSITYYPAFGFDPRTNDYKVVRIAFTRRTQTSEVAKTPLVEIYSLNEGFWRIISAGASYPPGIGFNYWTRPAASLNGAVHFVAYVKGNAFSPLVLSFDLGDEVFRTIPVPNGTFRKYDDVCTTVIGGSLTLLCHDPDMVRVNNSCSWVMKDYGVVDSWTKQCTVDLNRPPTIRLDHLKNGHILVEAKAARLPPDYKLSLYDLESEQNLGICEGLNFIRVDDYMENLVLLDKPDDALSKRGMSRKRKCM